MLLHEQYPGYINIPYWKFCLVAAAVPPPGAAGPAEGGGGGLPGGRHCHQ